MVDRANCPEYGGGAPRKTPRGRPSRAPAGWQDHAGIGARRRALLTLPRSENLIAAAPADASAYFYRSAAGAELDLVLEFGAGERWAIEIKRSLSPTVSRGFHSACEDLRPNRCFLVYPGNERFPLAGKLEAIPLQALMQILRSRK